MPRIRTIKPEMFESEKLGRCTPLARITFVGLIALADDEGRGRGALEWLKGRLHAYDPKARRDLHKATNELALARLVRFYVVGGAVYYVIPSWPEHQKIQHPSPSKLPPPPEDAPTLFTVPHEDLDKAHEDSRKPHEDSREDLGPGIRDLGPGNKEGPQAVPGVGAHEDDGGNGAGKRSPKQAGFEPPTPAEVRAWIQEKHPDWLRTVNPVAFCAYYESQGWKVGKNPMKNWHAAVVTWANK